MSFKLDLKFEIEHPLIISNNFLVANNILETVGLFAQLYLEQANIKYVNTIYGRNYSNFCTPAWSSKKINDPIKQCKKEAPLNIPLSLYPAPKMTASLPHHKKHCKEIWDPSETFSPPYSALNMTSSLLHQKKMRTEETHKFAIYSIIRNLDWDSK